MYNHSTSVLVFISHATRPPMLYIHTGVPRTENTVAVFQLIISRDGKFDLRDLSSGTNVVAVQSIRGHQTYY